eukprot:GFUD01056073.1.p1 GENE.GFUD01056073.1~~GFUD01056073.1.p1  ORF type:complete len:152 (+),score=24.19 GFUD01056073.1:72-527(+)
MVAMKVMRAALGLLLATQVCSSFWLGMCGGRYYFSENSATWTEAIGFCQRYGGHLLQIENIQENNCLLKEAMSRNKAGVWWHNANDRQVEGVLRHGDGGDVLWQPWWYGDIGRPDGGSSEDCFSVYISGNTYAGVWNDRPCSFNLKYICEK